MVACTCFTVIHFVVLWGVLTLWCVSAGGGRAGRRRGHQICRQHSQRICHLAVDHHVHSHFLFPSERLQSHRVMVRTQTELDLWLFNQFIQIYLFVLLLLPQDVFLRGSAGDCCYVPLQLRGETCQQCHQGVVWGALTEQRGDGSHLATCRAGLCKLWRRLWTHEWSLETTETAEFCQTTTENKWLLFIKQLF